MLRPLFLSHNNFVLFAVIFLAHYIRSVAFLVWGVIPVCMAAFDNFTISSISLIVA